MQQKNQYSIKFMKIELTFLRLPFVATILLLTEKLTVFLEKNLKFYIPVFYKIGMFLSL